MNVQLFSGEGLEPLLEASEAEGFRFVSRLLDEWSEGGYERPYHLLLGAYENGELVGIGGLTPDPYLEPTPSPVGRVPHLYVCPNIAVRAWAERRWPLLSRRRA